MGQYNAYYLVYWERFLYVLHAIAREKQSKGWTREEEGCDGKRLIQEWRFWMMNYGGHNAQGDIANNFTGASAVLSTTGSLFRLRVTLLIFTGAVLPAGQGLGHFAIAQGGLHA